MATFDDRIKDFNMLHGLPARSVPDLPELTIFFDRMVQFFDILVDEMEESTGVLQEVEDLATLTALADWLGDIQVYCASEMCRYGIPIEPILQIIMESNMTKLGSDGLPAVVNGRIQKGPGYQKPEPKIREYLHALRLSGGL